MRLWMAVLLAIGCSSESSQRARHVSDAGDVDSAPCDGEMLDSWYGNTVCVATTGRLGDVCDPTVNSLENCPRMQWDNEQAGAAAKAETGANISGLGYGCFTPNDRSDPDAHREPICMLACGEPVAPGEQDLPGKLCAAVGGACGSGASGSRYCCPVGVTCD